MNEQQLRERMADLVGDQPTMRHGSADDLRRGRRRVAVSRGAAVVGTAGLVGAVVAGVSLADGLGGDGTPVAGLPDASTGRGVDPLVQRCTQVDNGALDPVRFGPGSTVVTQESDVDGDVSAVIIAADRQVWGECHLFGPDAEFNGAASAYPMDPTGGNTYLETNGMGFGSERFSYVDRFPSDVARVTVEVDEGVTLSARAVDGFVAFQRVVPGLTMGSSPSFDVTLYGAGGEVLADKTMVGGDASLPVEYRTLVPEEALPAGGAQ
jgi:hypothetical protein